MTLCLALLLISCTPQPAHQSFHAFGTTVEVTIDNLSSKQAQPIFEHIDTMLQSMHHRWHAWQESELSAIQRACETGESVTVANDIVFMITRAQQLETSTQGYFNPTAGELIDAWGFLSHTSTQSRKKPHDAFIQTLLSHQPSTHDLHIQNQTLTCTNPHVRLDLGAFGKGYGIGLIRDYLVNQGIENAMINAGGDIVLIHDGHSRPKRIAIAPPFHNQSPEILTLNQSVSIFTSGTQFRKFTDSETGEVFHHVINPLTGYPSQKFVSVTVLHEDPLTADALATALLASDESSWQEIVERNQVERCYLWNEAGERFSC